VAAAAPTSNVAILVVILSLLGRGDGALALLADERLVDVGDDTAAGDGGLNQRVQLLVTSDGQLKMSGGDPLDLEILGSVAGQLQHLGSQVLQDGRAVHGGRRSDSAVGSGAALEMSVNTSHRELKPCSSRSGNCLLLGLSGILASFTSSHFGRSSKVLL